MATATQDGQIDFPAANTIPVGGIDVTHYGIYTAASGGTEIFGAAISGNPAALTAGQRYTIADDEIEFTLTPGTGFTEQLARILLSALDTRTTNGVTGVQLYVGLKSNATTEFTTTTYPGYLRQAINFTIS